MKILSFSSIYKFSSVFHRHQSILQTKLFINGSFVPSFEAKTIPVINPSDETVLAEVHEATPKDVDLAVESAKNAYVKWSSLYCLERGACVFKLADIMNREREKLAWIESQNTGKPYKFSSKNDLSAAINMFRYYAGYADKIHGQSIPLPPGFQCFTKPEPIGVCAQILPWNFPLAGLAAKIAPALIAGCTVVLKPAELTPLSALYLAQFFKEAGIPPGTVNIINGYGSETGEYLMKHPDIKKVSFTGSTAVGLHIMKNCHANGLKKVSLELGGKSPYIVMDDADIDFAVKQAQGANFYNTGQICISGSRVFVHEKIYDAFVKKSVEVTKERVVGDPFEEKTDLGPLISGKQRERYLHYVNKGKSEGANLLIGGNKIERKKGFYVEPTVFSEVSDDMTIAKEEIFGPVMSILKFKSIDEVIERANQTHYGLVAGVITGSMEKAMRVVNEVKCGTVWVNCYGVFESNAPYGGVKNSGIGKEHGEVGIKEYLDWKTVIIKA